MTFTRNEVVFMYHDIHIYAPSLQPRYEERDTVGGVSAGNFSDDVGFGGGQGGGQGGIVFTSNIFTDVKFTLYITAYRRRIVIDSNEFSCPGMNYRGGFNLYVTLNNVEDGDVVEATISKNRFNYIGVIELEHLSANCRTTISGNVFHDIESTRRGLLESHSSLGRLRLLGNLFKDLSGFESILYSRNRFVIVSGNTFRFIETITLLDLELAGNSNVRDNILTNIDFSDTCIALVDRYYFRII